MVKKNTVEDGEGETKKDDGEMFWQNNRTLLCDTMA